MVQRGVLLSLIFPADHDNQFSSKSEADSSDNKETVRLTVVRERARLRAQQLAYWQLLSNSLTTIGRTLLRPGTGNAARI
jgi:hypothetical protein